MFEACVASVISVPRTKITAFHILATPPPPLIFCSRLSFCATQNAGTLARLVLRDNVCRSCSDTDFCTERTCKMASHGSVYVHARLNFLLLYWRHLHIIPNSEGSNHVHKTLHIHFCVFQSPYMMFRIRRSVKSSRQEIPGLHFNLQ